MLLTDREIRKGTETGLIKNCLPENIGSISYDLRVDCFCSVDDHRFSECRIKPGESVFVQSVEGIELPDDVAARVHLRNSRIRQGLTLDAPVYYPGHKTIVYFRVTNVSDSVIHLKAGDGIASLTFEKLGSAPESVYSGAFQDEMEFRGMASYTDIYRKDMEEIEEKKADVKHIEKSIYANVITVMTVFIGLFSLINVNVSLAAAQSVSTASLLIFNLSTVGSVGFLTALLRTFFPNNGKHTYVVWTLSVAAFIMALTVHLLSA